MSKKCPGLQPPLYRPTGLSATLSRRLSPDLTADYSVAERQGVGRCTVTVGEEARAAIFPPD